MFEVYGNLCQPLYMQISNPTLEGGLGGTRKCALTHGVSSHALNVVLRCESMQVSLVQNVTESKTSIPDYTPTLGDLHCNPSS